MTETETAALPADWSALLIPFGVVTGDGRLIPAPSLPLAELHRPLPLPLMWSPGGVDLDAPGSAQGAIVGQVTHLAIEPPAPGRRYPELWAHGTLDTSVPGFAELVAAAWRTRAYMPGLPVGVDLDNIVVREVTDEDGDEDARYPYTRAQFDGFRLIGVTINTGPAWPNTRLILTPPGVDADNDMAPPAPHPEA